MPETNSTQLRFLRSERTWWLVVGIGLAIGWMLVREPRLIGLLRNSLLLAGGTCLISLPIGTLIGLVLFRTDLPFRQVFLWLIVAAMFLPLYLYAAAWSAGFGQLGWFPLIGDPPRPILSGWVGAIWVHSMAAIPWVSLVVGIGSLSVNANCEEAGLLDAGPLSVLCRITLPAVFPAVIVAGIWILIVTMGEMTVTDIFRIRTYVEEVFYNLQQNEFSLVPIIAPWEDRTGMYSIDIWTQLAMLIWMVLSVMLMASVIVPISSVANYRPALIFELRKSKGVLLGLVALLFVFILGVPLFNLIHNAGFQNIASETGTQSHWSLELLWQNAKDVPRKYGSEFLWTALLGLGAATLSLLITLPLAWLARTGSWLYSMPALIVAAIGFAIPGPMIGVIVIGLLDHPESKLMVWLYDRTLLAPIIAISVRVMPLTILFCWQAMRNVSEPVLDQARLDGMSWIERFWLFGVRQNWIAITAVWVLALVIALGDLASSSLVIPPGIDSLQRRIFGMIHAGIDDQVAILSLANIGFVLPWIMLFGWLVLRKK